MKKEFTEVVVFITTGSEEEARSVAMALVERRIAACVNIVAKIESLFWWQGKLDSARESLLIIKTKASLLPEIIDLVKEVHSYEVPEVIALPIVGGNPDYLKWLNEETARGL